MPFQPGRAKTGGRVAGDSSKGRCAAACARLGIKAEDVLAQMAAGSMPCSACMGASGKPTGKTKYKSPEGTILERTCESCYGTLREHVPPKDRGWAAAQLLLRIEPPPKPIELSGALDTGAGEIARAILRRLDGKP